MPDLLGVTNPVPGYDRDNAGRNAPVSPNQNPQIQNPVDPGRVGRADGRTEQRDNTFQDTSGQVRYDSNFSTFIQRLRESPDLAAELARLFAQREGLEVRSGMSDGIAAELSQALKMLHMDQGQLLQFLTDQFRAGTRFGGALFALLRSAYSRASSENVRMDILQFLKSYGDYSATAHIEGNLLRNLQGMAKAMPASWAEKLQEMIARLQNGIAAGDRQGNLKMLRSELFPYMSEYVDRTHDMGTARSLLSQLTLDVARYENGSINNLLELYHQLTSYGTLREQLGGVDDQSLLMLLRSSQFSETSPANQFADHLAAAAARALRGEGSMEIQQIFQQLVSAMLINESVYMPVNHFILPLEWDGKMLFSELWVDPDAEEKDGVEQREHGVKILFKIDVQPLGLFDIVLTSWDKKVDLQIACPMAAVPFAKEMEKAVSGILERNQLTPGGVVVRRMERPLTISEVFPKILERKNSVNVKV